MPLSPPTLRPTPLGGLAHPAFDPFATRGATRDTIEFDKRAYDLRSILLNGAMNDGPTNKRGLDREYEISANIANSLRNANNRYAEPNGVWVPSQVWCRDAVSDTGGDLVQTTVEPSIAAALLPYSACLAAGARTITDLRSNFAQPIWQADMQPSGVPENFQVTTFPGDTFALRTMTPIRGDVDLLVSRQLIVQSSPDFERFLREQLLRSVASKVDNWVLAGSGTNQPTGIINLSANTGGGNSVALLAPTITFGGAPTYNSLTTMISNVTSQNVSDDGSFGWIISEASWKIFKETAIIAGYPRYLIEDGRILEKRCYQTNNLSSALGGGEQVVFGRWSDCVIGFWGDAIDILSNPFTFADSGVIYIRAGILVNFVLIHANAFTISTDSGAQ
jgi:HK97 family phage major capsid protein